MRVGSCRGTGDRPLRPCRDRRSRGPAS
jgi:hypothetical protein